MSPALYVVGTGAVSCVGFNAGASCAAVRAAVDGFSLTGFRDQVKGPTVWAEVPLKPSALEVNQFSRLVAIGGAALHECAESVGELPTRCALLLSVREPFRRVASNSWRSSSLLTELLCASGLSPHPDSVAVESGNAGAVAALLRARELLNTRRADLCLVGGVDSYLNAPDLELFGRAYRLKSDDVVQGFIPSEGAAFIALSTVPTSGVEVRVLGVGTAQEGMEGCVVSPQGIPQGKALVRAVLAACSDAGIAESAVEFRLSDMNGEVFRVRENSFAITRAYRTRREHLPRLYPASSVGEIGAATSAFLMVLATTAFKRGYAPGAVAMCEAASDGGLRAACVLRGT